MNKLDIFTSDEKSLRLCIVGLGYVGLPLAVEFAKERDVVGFDISEKRVVELRNHIDKTLEVSPKDIAAATGLHVTNDANAIKDCNCFIVTVPSPIDEHNQPNFTPLQSACRSIGAVLKKGDLIIFESTVYPGFTKNVCVEILQNQSGLKYNEDFFCGYSPERINPGDKVNTLRTVIKITSGSTPEIAQLVDSLYSSIIDAGTYLAPSIEVAEAAKVIENAQRDLNIAFVNELAMIFDKLGIDTTDVLQAAGTKWNFLPFKPGMVGGHCIGVDPYYLTFRAIEVGQNPEITLAGRRINDSMAKYIAKKMFTLTQTHATLNGKLRIGILGVTFKENCPDTRNSKVFDLIEELVKFGVEIMWHDPYCDSTLEILKDKATYCELTDMKKSVDCVICSVGHSEYRTLSTDELKGLYRSNTFILGDVKALYNKDIMEDSGFILWRL